MEKKPNKPTISKQLASNTTNKAPVKNVTNTINTSRSLADKVANKYPSKTTTTSVINPALSSGHKATNNKTANISEINASNPSFKSAINKSTNAQLQNKININTTTNATNKIKTTINKPTIKPVIKNAIKPPLAKTAKEFILKMKNKNVSENININIDTNINEKKEITISEENYKPPESPYFYREYVKKAKLEIRKEPIANFKMPKIEGEHTKTIPHFYKNKNLGDIIIKEYFDGGCCACDGWNTLTYEMLIPQGIEMEILKYKNFPRNFDENKILLEEPFISKAVVYYLGWYDYDCSKDDYSTKDLKLIFKHFAGNKSDKNYNYEANSNTNTYVYHVDSYHSTLRTLKSLTCYYAGNFQLINLFFLKILNSRKYIGETTNVSNENLNIIKIYDKLRISPKIILSQIFRFLPKNTDWPWKLE